jgi:hypothetical protein
MDSNFRFRARSEPARRFPKDFGSSPSILYYRAPPDNMGAAMRFAGRADRRKRCCFRLDRCRPEAFRNGYAGDDPAKIIAERQRRLMALGGLARFLP